MAVPVLFSPWPMNKPFDGAPPKLLANVSIKFFADGRCDMNAQAADPLLIFAALGQAGLQLAAECRKQQAGKTIEIAPAELLNKLHN